MANSTAFDDLPAEIICETFSFLNFNELIACKLVCKRFREIVCMMRIRRLNVHFPEKEDIFIDEDEAKVYSSEFCHPNLFRIQMEQSTLSRLRSLTIADSAGVDLNKLNQLSELEQLKIGNPGINQKESLTLTFPKLKDLEFFQHLIGWQVSLDCPILKRLSSFGWSCPRGFTVKHPETITTLQIDFTDESLWPFKNVEYLSSNNYKILNESTLLVLSELKEIRYSGSYDDFMDHFDSRLKSFMNCKKALGKFDLKVFFGCVELLNDKRIDDYQFEQYHQNIERFYMANYRQLVRNDASEVNYTKLMDALADDEIPSDYFDRFDCITSVQVFERPHGRKTDQVHLLWFLKSLKKGLRALHMNVASVHQRFLDQLPEFCSSTLEVLDVGKPGNFNWNFANKLTKLKRFWITGRTLGLREIKFLLKTIHNGSITSFQFNGYEVERIGNENNLIQLGRRNVGIDELVEFFKKTMES